MLYAYAPVSPELQRMTRTDDFNKNELWIVQTTLQERYGEVHELQTGGSEICLHSADRDLTECIVTLLQTEADKARDAKQEQTTG